MGKRQSRFASWRVRVADRLAQSSQVFLLGLLIACGIEVLVDWNQTLTEVNILRDQIRQKGLNYAGLLERAIAPPILAADRTTLDRLACGLIDDEDAVYVRVVDARGQFLYDRLDPLFEKSYVQRGRGEFRQHYEHWIERDLHGVIDDPEGFRQRLANSRYRDVPQIYNDLMSRLVSRFSTPPPLPPLRAQIVYQDRLRDENHRRDDTVTWAIAPLSEESAQGSRKVGAVLVAFDMTRTNRAVRSKYLKGAGMIVFFVAFILVQNIIGRRDKLRLFDLGRRYAAAKSALHQAMPQAPLYAKGDGEQVEVQGQIDQAHQAVDGMVWDRSAAKDAGVDVLIADPDGDGIDAAAVGLHVLRIFRGRRQPAHVHDGEPAPSPTEPAGSLEAEVQALGSATRDIPLTRPLGLLLLRLQPGGRFEALLGDMVALYILRSGGAAPLAATPLETALPEGIVGPLFRAAGELECGGTLLCIAAGKGQAELHLDGEALTKFLLRSQAHGQKAPQIEELLAWIRGKYPGLADKDLAVVTLRRTAT